MICGHNAWRNGHRDGDEDVDVVDGNGNGTTAAMQVDRKKILLETVRDSFRRDFEFIDVRDDLMNDLLTEDQCRHVLESRSTEGQLDRLFFLLTYNEKKSIERFAQLIRPTYDWLSSEIEACLEAKEHQLRDSEDMKKILKCIEQSCFLNKSANLVFRCELVSGGGTDSLRSYMVAVWQWRKAGTER